MLNHTIIAITSDWWLSAAIGSAFYIGRELAQAEYQNRRQVVVDASSGGTPELEPENLKIGGLPFVVSIDPVTFPAAQIGSINDVALTA